MWKPGCGHGPETEKFFRSVPRVRQFAYHRGIHFANGRYSTNGAARIDAVTINKSGDCRQPSTISVSKQLLQKAHVVGRSVTVTFPNTESRAACETAGTKCRYRCLMASVV